MKKKGIKNNFLFKEKKGTLLFKHLTFILVVLIFFSILFLFVSRKGDGAIVLEQSSAKNIALLIDAGKPVMEMKIKMTKSFDLASKNKIPLTEIVQIKDNYVTVKLSEKGGYTYSFFNDVDVVVNPDESAKEYIILIKGYKENKNVK